MQHSNVLLMQLSQLFPASDKQSINYIADVLISQSPNNLNMNLGNRSSTNPLLPAYTNVNFQTYQPQYAQAQYQEEPTTCSYDVSACGINSNFSVVSTSPSMIGEKKDIFDVDESMFDFGDAFEYNMSSDDMTPEQPEKMLKGSKKINKTKNESKAFPDKERKQRATSRRGLWKAEEDALLRELYEAHGPKWAMIGTIIGNKSGKQVRDRYNNISRPDINSNEWTEEEDALFVSLLEKYGNKWCTIAAEMPGRTESQVKNKFYCLKKNKRSRNQRKIALKQAIATIQQKGHSSESSSDFGEDLSNQETDCTPPQISRESSLYSDIDCFFQFNSEESPCQEPFNQTVNFNNYSENVWQEIDFAI